MSDVAVIAPFCVETAGDQIFLQLGESISIRHAHELWSAVVNCCTAGSSVQVDAAQVETVDTSILQILLSIRRSVSSFRIDKASPDFVRLMGESALTRDLSVAQEI